MKGFVDDIETLTLANTDFRRVLYTGHNLQLVLMTLQPGEEIGAEVHSDRDQFFRIEAGVGEVTIDGKSHTVRADDAIIVPQGARHNVTADGSDLFLLGLCSVIDAIMGRPMVLVLEELPVSRSIKDALLGETNNVRPILDTVIAYEQGNWNEAGKAAARAGLSAHALPSAYADALRWAHELERDSAT